MLGHMDALISTQELAATFDVTPRKIIDWVRRYGWPHVKVGRTIAFLPSDVEQILATHHVDGTKEYNDGLGRLPGQTYRSALHNRKRGS